MPALWMRTYSNTLLERSRAAALRSQQAHARHKGVPWGISESAYFKLDETGNYQYHAFGLSHLAMRKCEVNGLVISPYSTLDRKSTRLNSSHTVISYAVFCLKKKKK